MKRLYENWKTFLKEEKTVVPTRDEMIAIIRDNPDQKMHIDFPKGTMKKFRGEPKELLFDYGEWSDFINPADDMGWDFVIVPSADPSPVLVPVGYVAYKANIKANIGNDKIIIAPNGIYSDEDKQIIDDFYSTMKRFDNPVWY